MPSNLTHRAAALALALGAVTAPTVAGAPGAVAAPQPASVVALPADTSTPTSAPSSTAPVTHGTGGDRTSGFLLGGVVLATLVGLGAYFLRGRSAKG